MGLYRPLNYISVVIYLDMIEEGSTPSISANLSMVENLAGLPFSSLHRLSGLIPAISASLD